MANKKIFDLTPNGAVADTDLFWKDTANSAASQKITGAELKASLTAGFFKADGSVDMSGQFRTDVGTFDSDVADGATANAYTFDTQVTYSTAGANLLRLSNNADVMMDFSFQGGIDHVNSGATTAAHSQSLNLNWVSATTSTSSGQYSCVIGQNCRAAGITAIAAGFNAAADANYTIAIGNYALANSSSGWGLAIGGASSSVYAAYASAIGGESNRVDSSYSVGMGRQSRVTNKVTLGFGAGYFAAQGDAQFSVSGLKVATTDATQTTLLADAAAFVIPADTAWAFSALIVARSDEADGNNCAIYKIEGGLKRDESNNTALVGTPTVTVIAEDTDAAPWSVDAVADDTNEALSIRVTGESSTNIRWVAKVDIAQVTFA